MNQNIGCECFKTNSGKTLRSIDQFADIDNFRGKNFTVWKIGGIFLEHCTATTGQRDNYIDIRLLECAKVSRSQAPRPDRIAGMKMQGSAAILPGWDQHVISELVQNTNRGVNGRGIEPIASTTAKQSGKTLFRDWCRVERRARASRIDILDPALQSVSRKDFSRQ